VQAALGKARFTLGKGFAECRTRQRIRRQRILCRVPPVGHSAKPLPSAMSALGKVNVHRHLPVSLPSADVAGTRQRVFNFF